jgi:hypothetical protein
MGWISGLLPLASVRAKYIPMAPSTAFCFSLIGIGLIVHLLRASLRWLPRAFASLVLAMACAKLVEPFGGFHFGIDAWFVRNPELFGAVPMGRMAPMTALNFVFIATGLLALTGKRPAKFAGPLGALATAIGAVVLVGYWYGTRLLYRGPHHSGRVFHRLRFFSVGDRHRDGGGRSGMAVASISWRLHSRGLAARVCAPDYRSGAYQWLDQCDITDNAYMSTQRSLPRFALLSSLL